MPGTTFMGRILSYFVGRLVFWCVGIPVAVLFAAYLAGIVVMCTKELWAMRKNDQKRREHREKTDPLI